MKLGWDDVDNTLLGIILDELIDNGGDILLKPGEVINHEMELADRLIILRLSRRVLRHEPWKINLRGLKERYNLGRRLISEWKTVLMLGGHGIHDAAFRIRIERYQCQIDPIAVELRKELSVVCATPMVRIKI